MSKYNFSVVIFVDSDETPTDDSIGLQDGVFQWFLGGNFPDQEPFSNGQDILSRDGISPITKSVKVERFGDIATSSGLTLKIRNTDIFWKKFLLAFGDNASLHGSTCYILQWENGISEQIFVGVCDIPNFDKSSYRIPVRATQEARDSTLTGTITEDFKRADNSNILDPIYTDSEAIGKTLPITFGENGKTFFLQTGDKEENVLVNLDNGDTHRSFPWVSGEKGTAADPIKIQLTNVSAPTTADLNNIASLITEGYLFLKCISGTAQGEISQIVAFDYEGVFDSILLTLSKPYYELASADCIFTLVDIRKEYNSDFWNCEGFINENGDSITANAEISQYDQGYQELPSFTLDINSDDLMDNELIQKDLQVSDNGNDVVGFEVLQKNNASIVTSTEYFDVPADWTYEPDLLAFSKSGTFGNEIVSESVGDTALEDGSDPFQWNFDADLGNNTGLARVFDYELPQDIPDDFDSIYVVMLSAYGYTFDVGATNKQSKLTIKKGAWFGGLEEVYTGDGTGSNQVINFPVSYSAVGLSSEAFWTQSTSGNVFSGYKLIDLGISNRDEYLKYDKLAFTFELLHDNYIGNLKAELDFFSLGLLFVKSNSIDKGVYTPFRGRLYDADLLPANNWGQNDLIQDPIGALLHGRYLQNFSNVGVDTPSLGWGKEYPTAPVGNLIETTFNEQGSYYTQDLEDFDFYSVKIAHQITESKSVGSRAYAKDICNRFFLISWVGANGLEKVEQVVQKTNADSLPEITQLDMLSYGSRVEWDTRNIFCEPVVNYSYDVGAKKFNNSMSINNVSSDLSTDAEKAEACRGMDFLTESQRVVLWERARALFLYYGVINEPPKILSDHTWIDSQASAYWYIRKWLRFQGSEYMNDSAKVIPKNYFDFSVPYEIGENWDIGTRLNVKLPNITDDVFYEFIVTSITKNVSDELPNIAVKGILFDLDVRVDDTIQDSTDETLENWQDTTDPNNENIQDEV